MTRLHKAMGLLVAAVAALLVGALLGKQHARRAAAPHQAAVAATATATATATRAERPHAPLSWSIDGPPAATARVAAQLSAEQWSQRLRDAVCACRDATCAASVQQRYASNFGAVDFASGDQERIADLRDEAAACTVKLLDAAHRGS